MFSLGKTAYETGSGSHHKEAITLVSDSSRTKINCPVYNCVSPVSSFMGTTTAFGSMGYDEPLVAHSKNQPDVVNINTANFCIKFMVTFFFFFLTN